MCVFVCDGVTCGMDYRGLLPSKLGMLVLLHIYFFFHVCVCPPPICVGLAGGQSDGELENWMWHYIPASYHSDIWPNRTHRG